MSVSCRIDSEAGIVYTSVRAPADAKQVTEAITMTVAKPEFRPGLNGIADLREAGTDYSPKDVQWIADLLRAFRDQIGPSRTAIVVSEDAVELARQFQSMSLGSSVDTEIFRTMEEARAWVGAPGEDVERPGADGP